MKASDAVGEFLKKTMVKTDDTFRQVCLEMSSRIIKRSPVDSGRFKGNWNASINTPDTTITDNKDESGAATIDKAKGTAYRLTRKDVFCFTNNLPYAYRLEYEGWSDQATKGMVRVTAAEFQNVVNSTVRSKRGN